MDARRANLSAARMWRTAQVLALAALAGCASDSGERTRHGDAPLQSPVAAPAKQGSFALFSGISLAGWIEFRDITLAPLPDGG